MLSTVSQHVKEFYEFGPFRLDAQRQILLRAGETVSLTPKNIQVLLVLVRHSPQVVGKDDLMKAVWPDTFVDEANLSRNIFMLRKALGETRLDHEYIITVPGQGYRLAEGARLVLDGKPSIVDPDRTEVESHVNTTKRWMWAGCAIALVFATAIGTLRFVSRRPTMLTGKDTLVLADFANSTGDPVFDGALRQGLAAQLEQSPFVTVLSEERIRHTLRLMEQPDARLTPEVARVICERTGSAAVIEGSIARLGSRYVLGLHVESCRGAGQLLDEQQAEANRKEDVLNVLDRIASKFRARVGESLRTIQMHDMPLAKVTTPSLEALKVYSAAWKVAFSNGSASAVPLVKRAVEIDPRFAMAYAYLGRLYGDIGESKLSGESTGQAYKLRDRVSDPERFFIAASYDRQVTGNLEQARQTCELWAQAYPRDAAPHSLLSGAISVATGRYDGAVEEAKRAIDLDPDLPWGYANLAASYLFLGRLEQGQATLQRAFDRKLEMPDLLVLEYGIALLRSDMTKMQQVAASAQARTGVEDRIIDMQGSVLAYSGQLEQASRMSRRAQDLAKQAGQPERAAHYAAGAAVREAFFGNLFEAKRSATAALELSRGRDVEYRAAIALALSGEYSRSETLANDLEKRLPVDTLVRFNYVPTLRALLALKHGKPTGAIELLEDARPYELGFASSGDVALIGSLYPVYARGLAYLAEHRGPEAAAEFEKIINRRGIVLTDPIGALAHLQLGRAYVLSGDKAKTRAAYRDFLALWKDADPDIPIFKQAMAENAKLQ